MRRPLSFCSAAPAPRKVFKSFYFASAFLQNELHSGRLHVKLVIPEMNLQDWTLQFLGQHEAEPMREDEITPGVQTAPRFLRRYTSNLS